MHMGRQGVVRALGPVLLAGALAGLFTCKARHDQFYGQLHECDPTASRKTLAAPPRRGSR